MGIPNIAITGLPGKDKDWFRRPEEIEEVFENVRDTASILSDVIELPRKIKVEFGNDTDFFAHAYDDEIWLHPGSLAFLEVDDEESHDCFRGIVGHELSHLSDFATNNPAKRGWRSMTNKVVADGKADHIGELVGGPNFADRLLTDLPPDQKIACYTDLLLCGMKPHALKRWVERRLIRDDMLMLHQRTGHYPTGYSLIEDVVAWTDSPIAEIHTQPPTFFMEVLRDNIDSIESTEEYE